MSGVDSLVDRAADWLDAQAAQLQRAGLELKKKLAALGLGIGLGVGALVFSLFMLGFVLAGIAAALDLVMPTWAALLVVAGFLLLLVSLLAFMALGAIKRGSPPV